MPIKAVLFDFDGTLTYPGLIGFKSIRQALNCPESHGILEHINSISCQIEKNRAIQTLDCFEKDAALNSIPNNDAETTIGELMKKGILLGIFSRNSLESIIISMEQFHDVAISDFKVVISRDYDINPKPSPDGICMAAKIMKISKSEMIYVGDFLFDIEAGHSAGVKTLYLTNGNEVPDFNIRPDHVINRLSELTNYL